MNNPTALNESLRFQQSFCKQMVLMTSAQDEDLVNTRRIMPQAYIILEISRYIYRTDILMV